MSLLGILAGAVAGAVGASVAASAKEELEKRERELRTKELKPSIEQILDDTKGDVVHINLFEDNLEE